MNNISHNHYHKHSIKGWLPFIPFGESLDQQLPKKDLVSDDFLPPPFFARRIIKWTHPCLLNWYHFEWRKWLVMTRHRHHHGPGQVSSELCRVEASGLRVECGQRLLSRTEIQTHHTKTLLVQITPVSLGHPGGWICSHYHLVIIQPGKRQWWTL